CRSASPGAAPVSAPEPTPTVQPSASYQAQRQFDCRRTAPPAPGPPRAAPPPRPRSRPDQHGRYPRTRSGGSAGAPSCPGTTGAPAEPGETGKCPDAETRPYAAPSTAPTDPTHSSSQYCDHPYQPDHAAGSPPPAPSGSTACTAPSHPATRT